MNIGGNKMAEMLNKKDLLKKIQEVEFTVLDLNLYLDTHSKNERALMDYNMYSQELMKLKKNYEKHYGPLTNFGYAPSQYPWQWINEPWPWEMKE
jgi:spore coat protein JB